MTMSVIVDRIDTYKEEYSNLGTVLILTKDHSSIVVDYSLRKRRVCTYKLHPVPVRRHRTYSGERVRSRKQLRSW